MSHEKRIPPAALRLLGRTPWPYSPPTKAELNYWQQLFASAFPDWEPDECLMDQTYIGEYIAWLGKDDPGKISEENTLLEVVYQTWLNYLDRKEERDRLFHVAWRKTWNEGFARRMPLDELHKLAVLAGRRAQREFDFPDELGIGVDPSLDTLRERYEYYSYSRAEVRTAVEKELAQLKTNLAELRSIGGEKFNRETLPDLTRAIEAFLATRPALESTGTEETNQPEKQPKESTQLLALVTFADNARHIFDALTNLKKTLGTETAHLEELAWRLNEQVHTSGENGQSFEVEIQQDRWQRDFVGFEKSKTRAFNLANLAWERLAEFTGVNLTFHPAYTDASAFYEIIHYQQKTTNDLRIVAFCWAWHTYLKTADLEAARKTFDKLLAPDNK